MWEQNLLNMKYKRTANIWISYQIFWPIRCLFYDIANIDKCSIKKFALSDN